MSIDNLKLRSKALIPLAVMALVVLAMVVFGALKLSSISSSASEIIEKRDQAVSLLIRSARMVTMVPYATFGSLTYDNDVPMGKAATDTFAPAAKKGVELMNSAATLAPEKAATITTFKGRFEELVEKAKKPFRIAQDTPGIDHGDALKPEELRQMAQASRLLAEVDAEARRLVDDMVVFDDAFLAENAAAAGDLRAQSSSALLTMAVVGSISTLLAGAFSIWLTSSKIARPLGRLAERMAGLARGELATEIDGKERLDEVGTMAKAVEVFKQNAINLAVSEAEAKRVSGLVEEERQKAEVKQALLAQEQAQVVQSLAAGLEQLSNGNLVFRLDEAFASEYEQLRKDFNGAMEKLQDTMKIVAGSALTIRSGTVEISTASDDLSRRTEQQAASLEETAAALDEITATVKKTSDGSLHARTVVASAKADAEHSGEVVGKAVEAMSAIEASAQKVSQIIGVIDEIAFQTNLLALNAGVEAARAGEAGRGFAVVASEVRALAQRSAEAAKEIKALISTSSQQVSAGVDLVNETGTALQRIVRQVAEINAVVSDIATSTQEQATALHQVNTAINQMDQVTQQNAAMVEESTAASHALSKETDELSRLIARFQTGGETAGEPRSVVRQKAKPSRPAPVAAALKISGRGGAALKPQPAAAEESWQEF